MGERRPSPYPKIAAAIRAARRAGEKGNVRVEVDGIVVVSSPPGQAADPGTPLDKWMAEHARAS